MLKRQRTAIACAVVALGALGAAQIATAVTTVSRSGNTVTISGGDEINYVEQGSTSVGSGGPLWYSDPGGIAYGPGCVDAGANTVACGTVGPGLVANVSLGGGDDTFRPEYTRTDYPRLVVDLGAGNDTSWGSAQNDTLNGGPGDDSIIGMGGNDTIDGGDGKDRLTGSSGDDTVIGGPGADSLFGDGEFSGFNHGNDTLRAADGEVDALSCSFGADTAEVDANDIFDVLGDCEARSVASIGSGSGGGGGGAGSEPAFLAVKLGAPARIRLGALAGGKPLRFRITFSSPCTVAAGVVVARAEARRLKIGRKETIIARDAAKVPAAGTYPATLVVMPKYRAKLRKARTLNAYLLAVCVGADGATPSDYRRFVVRR